MNLEERVQILEGFMAQLSKSGVYTFEKPVQFLDGRNIQVGTGTGTKIGTATTQKLSVYGVTPVVQGTAINVPNTPGSSYSQTDAQTAVNSILALISAIKSFGITA